MQRVGNLYGIELKLDPAEVKWLGQSIRFSIQSRNLLKPTMECLISDQAGQTVFSKNAEAAERIPLVWMPGQPGNFTIKVTAKDLNRETHAEASFQVLDPRKMIPGFYLHF